MNKRSMQVARQIKAIRDRAARELGHEPRSSCPICGQSAEKPYRYRVDGEVVEGCVDAHHEESCVEDPWHQRAAALGIRMAKLAFLRKI